MSLADKGDSNYSVALRKSIFFQYNPLCISCEDDTVWVWNERTNISITSAVIVYRGAGWTGELWWCYTPIKIRVQACLQRVARSVALFALRWQTLQHESRARQTLFVIFGRGLSVWGASTRSDLHKCLLTLQPKLSRLFIFFPRMTAVVRSAGKAKCCPGSDFSIYTCWTTKGEQTRHNVTWPVGSFHLL